MSLPTNTPAPSSWAGSSVSDGVDLASVQFRDFYDVLSRSAQAATRIVDGDAKSAAEALSRQLCQLIELQSLEARRIGGKAGIEAEVQGRFLKAALADEVLLNTEWAGRGYWRHVLIEATLFKSSFAGERVFDDLDQLLREREPARRNLGRLYLYLLSLGFQGRYRVVEGPHKDQMMVVTRFENKEAHDKAMKAVGEKREAILKEIHAAGVKMEETMLLEEATD